MDILVLSFNTQPVKGNSILHFGCNLLSINFNSLNYNNNAHLLRRDHRGRPDNVRSCSVIDKTAIDVFKVKVCCEWQFSLSFLNINVRLRYKFFAFFCVKVCLRMFCRWLEKICVLRCIFRKGNTVLLFLCHEPCGFVTHRTRPRLVQQVPRKSTNNISLLFLGSSFFYHGMTWSTNMSATVLQITLNSFFNIQNNSPGFAYVWTFAES